MLRPFVRRLQIANYYKRALTTTALGTCYASTVRYYSSEQSIRTTKVSKHLILNECMDERLKSQSNNTKPLVLLFDWLYAKPSQLRKYSVLYHAKGLDVLTVTGRLSHFLWPPKGYTLAKELFDYLFTTRVSEDKLFVHAFSIGAFNYTIALNLAYKHPELYGMFRERLVGQVFDSIVIGTYDNMTEGIVTNIPGSHLKKGVVPLVDLYYRATSKKTKDEYDHLVNLFKEKPIHVPILFFYSENDPMCHVPTIETMLDMWRHEKPEFDVRVKSWKVSQHTAHLKNHPAEYLQEWNKLMDKVL